MKKVLFIIIIFLEVFILKNKVLVLKEFNNTIILFIYNLMPTIFYQLILSNIMINTDIDKLIPNIFKKINKKEVLIILLSIFSGYPNNVKYLEKSDNNHLNYVTNFINPLFLFVTVNSFINNTKLIVIIYISHVISNIILLLITKNKLKTSDIILNNNSYSKILRDSVNTILIIMSNLLFISLIISVIKVTLTDSIFRTILFGLIEFSKGIYEISYLNIDIYYKGLLILITISFSSISIIFQSISLNEKIKYTKFILYRLLSVFISIIIYIVLFKYF